MEFFTADLCDAHREEVRVVGVGLSSYGGVTRAVGEVTTIALDEDNAGLIALLKTAGNGRIAVVDAKGAYCAIVGDTLMGFAAENGWAGIVVNGYVRDTANTKNIPVGLWALGTCPMKSAKKAPSQARIDLDFLGVTFKEGAVLYADSDGMIVSETTLLD